MDFLSTMEQGGAGPAMPPGTRGHRGTSTPAAAQRPDGRAADVALARRALAITRKDSGPAMTSPQARHRGTSSPAAA